MKIGRYLHKCSCKDIFLNVFPQGWYLYQCSCKDTGATVLAQEHTYIFTFIFAKGRYQHQCACKDIFHLFFPQRRYLHKCSCKDIFLHVFFFFFFFPRTVSSTSAHAKTYFNICFIPRAVSTPVLVQRHIFTGFPQGRYLHQCSCKGIFLHLFSPGAVSKQSLVQEHIFTSVFPRGGICTSALARTYVYICFSQVGI